MSFGGILKDVSFAYVPDVKPGDFVLVHVGFALSKIDENEAGMGALSVLTPPEIAAIAAALAGGGDD